LSLILNIQKTPVTYSQTIIPSGALIGYNSYVLFYFAHSIMIVKQVNLKLYSIRLYLKACGNILVKN